MQKLGKIPDKAAGNDQLFFASQPKIAQKFVTLHIYFVLDTYDVSIFRNQRNLLYETYSAFTAILRNFFYVNA